MKIEKRWVPADLYEGPALADYPELMRRIYLARGVQTAQELNYELSGLHPYETLQDIHKAALRLVQVIEGQERIIVVGDFDTDGATSTALALKALQAFGASQVDFMVPNRFQFGYGLSVGLLRQIQLKKPAVILTVDNGISSYDGVAAAQTAGIDVIVTDHHLPGATLPSAYAIVNPNRIDDPFPSKALAGVGVVFYVMIALRAALDAKGHFKRYRRPSMAEYLDLVALGTVADLVPLDQNNRILVKQGLVRIRARKGSAGLEALLQVAGRSIEQTTERDLAFAVAPRLNAAGRLEDMALGIQCLLSKAGEATRLACTLNELNLRRRQIESTMKVEALEDCFHRQDKKAISLFREDWHVGVVGIVAARVKDATHRPAICFANDAQSGLLKGSARSIPGVHLRDLLCLLDARYPGLLVQFGGHAMAAGLAIEGKNFALFEQAFSELVLEQTPAHLFEALCRTDGQLAVQDFSLKSAHLLESGGPWGSGFDMPSFVGRFEVVEQKALSGGHLRLALRVNSQTTVPAVFFGQTSRLSDVEALVYRMEVHRYRQQESLQLSVEQVVCDPLNALAL